MREKIGRYSTIFTAWKLYEMILKTKKGELLQRAVERRMKRKSPYREITIPTIFVTITMTMVKGVTTLLDTNPAVTTKVTPQMRMY